MGATRCISLALLTLFIGQAAGHDIDSLPIPTIKPDASCQEAFASSLIVNQLAILQFIKSFPNASITGTDGQNDVAVGTKLNEVLDSLETKHRYITEAIQAAEQRDKRILDAINAITKADTMKRVTCDAPFKEVAGRCVHVELNAYGSWEQMRTFCQNIGGDLLTKLDDAIFFDEIIRLIKSLGLRRGIHFWIGMTDRAQEDHWVWLDGTPVRMGTPFWGYTEPHGGLEQNCGNLDDDHRHYFNDYICSRDSYAICMK